MSHLDWSIKNPREIEKVVSPIYHSPCKDKNRLLENHVTTAVEETRKAREQIPCTLNIPYGHNDSDQLDIYGTNLSSDSPIFLWVHGGAWVTGNKDWSGFVIRNAYSWGFRTVIVGYILCPDGSIREMCQSVEKAVEKAMTLFPHAKFILGGHSAGAQLIANILCGDSRISRNVEMVERISGFAFISAMIDIRIMQYHKLNEMLKLTPDEATDLSPVLNVHKISKSWLDKKNSLKVLIAVAKYDPSEFHRMGKELAKEMLKREMRHTEYWECDEDDHFTIVENFSRVDSMSGRKLRDFLLFAVSECKSML